MRKYLYAGAIAGGLLLLGGAPAYADPGAPGPATDQGAGPAGGLLGPGGNVQLDDPLGGAKVLKIKPGANSPDLTGAAGPLVQSGGRLPAARTGPGQAAGKAPRPAADVVRSTLPGTANTEGLPGGLNGLPIVGGLLGGGLPLGGGGLPLAGGGGLPVVNGGGLPVGGAPEAGLRPSDLPLLGGGLGGLLPFSMPRTLPAFSGMPAGGTAVAAQPAGTQPARTQPVSGARPAKKPAVQPDPATANDARLHEEPVDTEGDGRQFSSGRPVAGVDPDYK
jgi:hypothetical protein